MSTTTTHTVGMACGHCADAITDEVTEIAGELPHVTDMGLSNRLPLPHVTDMGQTPLQY